MSKSEELHARITKDNSDFINKEALEDNNRSRSSMANILITEAKLARVNNRIKELREESMCNHLFVPIGKIVNGCQHAICQKCGYCPSETTTFGDQLEVKIYL